MSSLASTCVLWAWGTTPRTPLLWQLDHLYCGDADTYDPRKWPLVLFLFFFTAAAFREHVSCALFFAPELPHLKKRKNKKVEIYTNTCSQLYHDNWHLYYDKLLLYCDNLHLFYDNWHLFYDNLQLYYGNAHLFYDNFHLCYDNWHLWYDKAHLCHENLHLCYDNLHLWYDNAHLFYDHSNTWTTCPVTPIQPQITSR